MKYHALGHSGLHVSNICLGSWLTYGNAVNDEESYACLDKALELGINFFDTADVYNRGGAEQVIGEWMQGQERRHIILATKVFFPMSDHPMDAGLSHRNIVNACAASLERLQTDYVDLYQCHRYDPRTPLEETCYAMNFLIEQGWALYWGVSQWTAVQLTNALRLCEKNGWRKPISNQPIYNMLNRSLEVDVMDVCAREGLGLMVYSPLAQGILSGKYTPGTVPEGSRAADPENNKFFSFKRLTEETFQKLDALKPVAQRLGISMAQLALAWTLRLPPVTTTIIGASRVAQVTENVAAAEVVLSQEVQQEIEQILANAPVDQYTGARIGYGA